MTRARTPRPHEVAAARRDPRLVRAFSERRESDRRTDDAWRSRGVCRRHDPETFFPAPSETPEAALSLCRGCDVQGACLAWALDAGDCHGVWGATTPRERRAMAIVWRDEAPPVEALPGALGEVVILASQRQPIIAEALNRAVRVAS
jgi:WhiB family transcriptional regulator, redox-sensing transcriptional regulator